MDNTSLFSIESFPPLPESIQKLNELCQVDDINLKSVIKVIESDPILYTDILRYSNVPFHGFRYPITTISQAISLFGISAIRGMALTAALKSSSYNDISMYGISLNEWFLVMEQQQKFLDLWLFKKHRSLLHSLGGLSFILEIGRLVASYALMLMEKSHSFSTHEPIQLSQEEQAVIGRSGDELASELFNFWNFEELFSNSLRYSLTPDSAIDTKACAALSSARRLYTLKGKEEFDVIIPMLLEYGFNVDDARTAYEMIEKGSKK